MDATNAFVLDGSITLVWGFEDEADDYAEAILGRMPDLQAYVPSLWPLEVANVLLMGERRKRSTQAKAAKWLRFLTALPIAVDTQTPDLAFDPILALARSHKLTAYDAAYLELAIRLGVRLAARDEALEKAAQAVGVPLFAPPDTP